MDEYNQSFRKERLIRFYKRLWTSAFKVNGYIETFLSLRISCDTDIHAAYMLFRRHIKACGYSSFGTFTAEHTCIYVDGW
jgi:hypothetical protein